MNKIKTAAFVLISVILAGCILLGAGRGVSQRTQTEIFRAGTGGVKLTVMHLSDIHYPKNGCALSYICGEAEKYTPDLIFLTGDIIDSSAKKDDIEDLNAFFARLRLTAPCFAVLGNHELGNNYLPYLKAVLLKTDVVLLENDSRTISVRGKGIAVAGVGDKIIYGEKTVRGYRQLDKKQPLLLLAHRPEKWELYLEDAYPPLATFAGHVHGGQVRFFGRGLYSPTEGFFPRYHNGLYRKEDSYMLVSRGLGDSVSSFRVFDPYHIPILELYL